MPFGPVDPQLNLLELERRALARWRDLSLPEAVQQSRAGGEPWVFYEGPPTANGRPGLHHVWTRVFKDLFIRFRTMRGHDVPRKGGWDCHGLPVEIEVEHELGLRSKAEIEDYGVGRFNERCRESVRRYVGDWEALTERAGVWIDTDDAYWTLADDYIESVWWLLGELFDRGLLYEGHRVVPYCYRCGTALSSHELGQPGAYRDVTDRSVFVRFPLVDTDADLLVWTTTPWTLVSNVAVAVGPDLAYVRTRDPAGGRDLVLAADLAPADAEVVEELPGKALVGRRYRRPLDLVDVAEGALRVVAGELVTTDEGSGLVHLAPAFGADDMDVARAEDLPVLNPVGPDGRFDASAGSLAGTLVKEADGAVIAALEAAGVLVREEPYVHSYPHCWRCGTPLIYWAKTSWFVATSRCRDELLAQNGTIDWHPEHIRNGRFGKWLEHNVDWALSRDRFWGTPLPIWRCDEGHDTFVGSRARMAELTGRDDLGSLDLHRPYVDEVIFACPAPGADGRACGGATRRVPPVLDAWFDSGSMPSAQLHHPFSGGDASRPARFPADFICEAIDQTRGWFYSLLAVNTLVFGETPYRAVVCLGLLVDENGQKMSKSKGNVIDPWDVFGRFGADALRWYFFSSGSPWSARRVSAEAIGESARMLITLWNVLAGFFVTYADIEQWPRPTPAQPLVTTHVLDRWVLLRLDDVVDEVTGALDRFDASAAAGALAAFVDDLSNWYVRRSRARFWGTDAPFAVLHRCLEVTAQLLAPFCPFLADEMHRVLTGERSVHLSDWPSPGTGRSGDGALRQEVAAAIRLVGLGRQAREQARVATRQPLRRALLLHPGVELSDDVRREVAEELNVKRLDAVADLADVISWKAVANFRALGPRLGAAARDVAAALADADAAALRRTMEAEGAVTVAGERLEPDDVEFRAVHHERFALAREGTWAVALDLELDTELEQERVARQLARALNDLRKVQGFAIADRVSVHLDPGPQLAAAVHAHRDWVAGQVLATELVSEPGLSPVGAVEIDVEGEPALVALALAAPAPD